MGLAMEGVHVLSACAWFIIGHWVHHPVSVTVKARIEGHRPGPLGILADHESQRATTARFQWPRATGSPSKGRVSFILVQNPEQRPPELARRTFPSSHLEPVRLSEERVMVAFLSDAPAWPRFLPRHAHSKGGM